MLDAIDTTLEALLRAAVPLSASDVDVSFEAPDRDWSGTRNAASFAFKISPGVSGSEWTSHINGSQSYTKDTLLDGASVTGYRVCVRPMPADGRSVVGWLPGAEGVYVAVTHSGVTLAAHLAGAGEGATPTAIAVVWPRRRTAGAGRRRGRPWPAL